MPLLLYLMCLFLWTGFNFLSIPLAPKISVSCGLLQYRTKPCVFPVVYCIPRGITITYLYLILLHFSDFYTKIRIMIKSKLVLLYQNGICIFLNTFINAESTILNRYKTKWGVCSRVVCKRSEKRECNEEEQIWGWGLKGERRWEKNQLFQSKTITK